MPQSRRPEVNPFAVQCTLSVCIGTHRIKAARLLRNTSSRDRLSLGEINNAANYQVTGPG